MNLLFLDAYFNPETIAYTHIENDLLEEFAKMKNMIQIICPIPTRGVSEQVREEYKGRKEEKMYEGKVIVKRFWAPQEGKNPIIRAIRYFWCNLQSYQVAIRAKSVDIVFSNSTPPTQGFLCSLVKKKLSRKYKRDVPLVYALQDVFPDSLVNAGLAKKGSLIWKIGRKMEDYTYRNADQIIVISEDIKRNIMEKGVPEEKIQLIYNWIDTQEVHPIAPENNTLLNELGLCEKNFYVVYAGNLGKAQGIGVILEAAELLKEHTSIKFLIFGNGAEEEFIRTVVEQKQLSNVHLYPLQPAERVSEVYSLGDVCVVACKKGNGVNAFPSKTVSIMATATPVLASFDKESELCRLVERYQCGVCCEPEDAKVMAGTILQLFGDSAAVVKMGKNARSLVESRFEKTNCTAEYVKLFKTLTVKSE